MQRVADGHTTTPEQTPGLEVGSQEGKVPPETAEPKPAAEEEDAETETDDERPPAVKPAEEPAAAVTPSGQPDADAKPSDEQQEDLSDPPMPNFDLPEDLKVRRRLAATGLPALSCARCPYASPLWLQIGRCSTGRRQHPRVLQDAACAEQSCVVAHTFRFIHTLAWTDCRACLLTRAFRHPTSD